MAARLVADAYWLPTPVPGDASSSTGGSVVGDNDSAVAGQRYRWSTNDGFRGAVIIGGIAHPVDRLLELELLHNEEAFNTKSNSS